MNKSIFSLVSGLLILFTLIYIELKQHEIYKIMPPDIERIVNYHPVHWRPVESAVTTPAWQRSGNAEYDKVAAKTYLNTKGEKITVVITWSRNGIQRAGHIQQLCYTTQGFEIQNVHDVAVVVDGKKQLLTAFTAKRITGVNEDVIYWRITDGKILTNTSDLNYKDYRLLHRVLKMNQIINSLYGNIPDNIMVRLSTVRTNDQVCENKLVAYAQEYLESIPESERKLVMTK